MAPIQHLPTEILSLILRLATSCPEIDEVTLNPALGPAIYLLPRPKELKDNLQTKATISRVCKQWNVVSAPFLCEFISCGVGRHSERIVACLEKEGEEYKGKRARWITHLDTRITELRNSPYPTFLNLPLFRTMASLSLTQGKRINLSDLRRLSSLCPRLEHLAVNILVKVDKDASIENFIVAFPHVKSLILEWVHPVETMRTTFQSWDLPKLHHLGFCLRGLWVDGLVLQILGDAASTLKSMDLCDFGRNSIIIQNEFFPSFPLLETLIIDPMTVTVPYMDLTDKKTPNLTTLGWRITRQTIVSRLHTFANFFRPLRFPNFKAVYMVYPQDVLNSLRNDELVYLGEFVEQSDWVPMFTLANQHLSASLLYANLQL